MMSRMVPRSVSIADLPFMEVGTAEAFLRLEVAMTDILLRRAGFGAGDRCATPIFIEYPRGKHNLARAGMIELKDKVIGQRSIDAFHSPLVTSNLALPT
jgi:hypothetical protein